MDEIQRQPELFPVLRVLADRPRKPARFLVLGSASPALLRQSSESLAGRIAYHELPGFNLEEVGTARLDRLWLLVYGRPPDREERAESLAFLKAQPDDESGWIELCRALLASNEFLMRL